ATRWRGQCRTVPARQPLGMDVPRGARGLGTAVALALALLHCAGAARPRPCACAPPLLNCSLRGRKALVAGDLCDGPLTQVDLSLNHFKELPAALGPTALQLNLSFNALRALPHPPLLNPALAVLDVAENRIENVLNLSRNRVVNVVLPSPCALRHLNLLDTLITTLGNLRECQRLEWLDASGNSLAPLPSDSFAGLSQLRYLGLMFVSMEEVPQGLFSGLALVEELKLDGNRLKALPVAEFAHLTRLRVLTLRQNPLSTLPSETLERLPALEFLD
ncbi:Leucine-rich repeats and immunoglobulin-like domains protein 3, partial [Gryllus bimaculatus]